MDIEANNFLYTPEVNHTHEGSIGNLCNAEIMEMMQQVVAGFNFRKVERALEQLLS